MHKSADSTRLFSNAELNKIDEILSVSSGKMSERLAHSVIHDFSTFEPQLTTILFNEEPSICHRAAWVIDRVGRINPILILPWLKENRTKIYSLQDVKSKASILNMLGRIKIPVENLFPFYDFASKQIHQTDSDSLTYYALKVMILVSSELPDLHEEIKVSAEHVLATRKKPYLLKYCKTYLNT